MPLTPFHLGPGILFGLLLLRYVDFPTFEMRAFTAFCLFFGVQLYLVYFLDLLGLDLRAGTTE